MTVGKHVYAVILAGGSGTRFWPKSRHLTPKQLCKIGSSNLTMIEKTFARLDGFIPPERRILVTHEQQLEATKKIVADSCGHYLAEPSARNTAAALALAALEIRHLSGDDNPIMISLHADHIIENDQAFRDDLCRAVAISECGYLTLMGIKPRRPETGYGYIEVGEPLNVAIENNGYRVASFREKPNRDIAQDYFDRGGFLWNSGYFIWQVPTILDELKNYLPQTHDLLWQLSHGGTISFNDVDRGKLHEVYEKLEKIAIDHAVLEVSERVAVIESDFGWYDLGSWDSLTECFPTDSFGNYTFGDVLSIDCEGSIIETDGPLVATVGLKDMVVVVANGAVLVCPKDRAQDVKFVVENLKNQNRIEFL